MFPICAELTAVRILGNSFRKTNKEPNIKIPLAKLTDWGKQNKGKYLQHRFNTQRTEKIYKEFLKFLN